ncbi:MAG TPA: NRAMP family divalent metal transporter [Phnomibacter sp.]|nr:NRAMP family divalent metal transporter [Phnomibacter sp.]
MSEPANKKWLGSAFIGAAFLMATSAIGPGFITQTTVFTAKQGASFGFVILVSIIIDIVVQLNIWNAIAASRMKASDLVNKLLPGAGYLLGVLVVAGGLVFNIGNVAGCGLGLQTLFGIDATTGAIASGVFAIIIFLVKEFGKAMDSLAKWLGIVMILMVIAVAIIAQPPMAEVVKETVWPSQIHLISILALVGGTVGGYISFAGAHRMLDASANRPIKMAEVNKAAVSGIVISGIMRVCLFVAAFGVIATGFVPDAANPAPSIFKHVLGHTGEKIFGIIFWCAAITSVVGASYTSASFMENWHPFFLKQRQWVIVGFIAIATTCFALFGQPIKILVAAGAINGLILPVYMVFILWAFMSRKLMPNFKQRGWLLIAGWIATILVAYMSWMALADL